MYDQNVFAVLIPCDEKNKARTAFGSKQNANRFHKSAGEFAEKPFLNSRQSTPAPLSPSEEDHGATDYILLTFDKPPKNPLNGWQFGTNEDSSDVFLGHRGTAGISSRQYNITIDENFCIFLHDFHSSYGTAVGYDRQKHDEVRKKETWLLSYKPGTLNPWKDVMIHSGGLSIKIEFPNQEAGRPQYIKNLQAFFEQSTIALPPVHALGLDSNLTTAAPSQSQTPSQQPIYLDYGLIGRGTFGEVCKVIKTRNGKCYAAKTFFPPPKGPKRDRKRKRDEEDWLVGVRNEIAIMADNPHVSVLFPP